MTYKTTFQYGTVKKTKTQNINKYTYKIKHIKIFFLRLDMV